MGICIGWSDVTKKKTGPKFNILLAVAFVVMVCYFFVSFFSLRDHVREAGAEVSAIESQAEKLEARNTLLQHRLDEGDLDSFVEQRARDEDLGYVYPDERVYYDMGAGQ